MGLNFPYEFIVILVVLALTLYYFYKKRLPMRRNFDPHYDFNRQSIEIDEHEHIRVATTLGNKPLIEYRYENVRTLNDVLKEGMEKSKNGPCLGYRIKGKGPYVWMSYLEVIEKTRYIGSGLVYKGIKPQNSTNIGIYSKNRPEWTITEYACYSFSMNVISLYDSYGKDSIRFILSQAEICALFIDDYNRVKNVIASGVINFPNLKKIIYFENLTSEQLKDLNLPSSIEILSWDELMEIGKENLQTPVPPKPSDYATICYTSGTTGNPKGALITHGNLIANEAAINERLEKSHLNILGSNPRIPHPVYMCYLPLAHMMERMSTVKLFLEGGQLGYLSGDVQGLIDDCQTLKPTNIPMVPRLLNKMYDRVHSEIGKSKIKSYILKKAIESKEDDRKRGIIKRNTIYDILIFKKIRSRLGGNVLRTATGSAPITKEVMEFSRSVFSCLFPEGYGQTEATCAITFSHAFEPEIGHCGPPLECVMVKLIDVPEMEYFAKNGKGEICAKGPSIFKGYLKDPEKTAETIDKDGWLHTGDIGMWLPNGCLKIIDRKKHIFKLSQGEYISPERIENVYSRSLFVSQIIVDGDSLKNCVIAILVPDQEYLLAFCNRENINGTFKELCNNNDVRGIIMKDLDEIAKDSDLMSYEKIRNIHLHDELFSIENGFTTPTLKYKRYAIRSQFTDAINRLYDEIESKRSSKL